MAKKKALRGFTLVELIMVVVLVVMLTSLATTRFVQSYQARTADYYVKELVFFLRYVQFKSIEEGVVHKLALDSDQLRVFVKENETNDFKEVSIPFLNQFEKQAQFTLEFREGNEIYFFPDGSVTPNQFMIMDGVDKKASIEIKNRLGAFQVIQND